MPAHIKRVELALEELKKGKMIILTDNADRENEGDLIVAAEMVSTENMNFMIRNGTGIVCIATTAEQLKKLDCPFMVAPNDNSSARGTPFTVSVDAKDDISTGVSASDRAKTVLAMIKDDAKPDDLVRPGHIFPLQADTNGVFGREGHTEGAVDLVKIAGFKPAAVLCEIMNPDGSMTRGDDLDQFAKKHQIVMLSISDLIAYRLYHEDMIEDEVTSTIPIQDYGTFAITIYKEKISGKEHVLLQKNNPSTSASTLVRIHSSCMTGDLFMSGRCDCHDQLFYSIKQISEEGGMLIYLNHEGRGIGLFNKIKAYALQDKGFDTVDANIELGLPIDSRQYYIAANILKRHQVKKIRLLTNNTAKVDELKQFGITDVERIAMPVFEHQGNHFYLKTKKLKLKHTINLKDA